MQTKTSFPVHSMASGSVAYALDKINQSSIDPIQPSYETDPVKTLRYAVWWRKSIEKSEHDPYPIENEIIVLRGEQFFSMLVGKERFWQMKAWGGPVATSEQTELLDKLLEAFETDPLEDGTNHPAEQIIRKALRFSEDRQIFDWFKNFSLDIEHPSFAASVLRCLGRQENPGTSSWRAELVHRGLTVDNVEIRDAAVQAVESWGDPELANILKLHHETEPWLREYILDVINDLGE